MNSKSKLLKTKKSDFKIRMAKETDIKLIMYFIKELAKYEKMLDEVEADEKLLIESLFRKKTAEVILGEYNNKPVGFAIFFHNFSTFIGRPGIYIEDIFIQSDMRNKGFGKKILCYIANLAMKRNCGRIEWSCLNWNEPSIKFYRQIGAQQMKDWTTHRLNSSTIKILAEQF